MANDHTFPRNFRRFAALVVKEASVVWCQYALLLLPVHMKEQTLQLNQTSQKRVCSHGGEH
jgi:hypothetical protein